MAEKLTDHDILIRIVTAFEQGGAEAAEAEAEEARKKREEAETALANERAARIALVLDGAISSGNITPAARPAWEKRLGEDFEAG